MKLFNQVAYDNGDKIETCRFVIDHPLIPRIDALRLRWTCWVDNNEYTWLVDSFLSSLTVYQFFISELSKSRHDQPIIDPYHLTFSKLYYIDSICLTLPNIVRFSKFKSLWKASEKLQNSKLLAPKYTSSFSSSVSPDMYCLHFQPHNYFRNVFSKVRWH